MIIKSIEFSLYQPSRTDVAWAKPVKGGFALYLYYNGKWEPHVLMDSVGTDSPEDDIAIDVTDIPSMDHLEDKIKEEVTVQITEHDAAVSDVHYEPSSDSGEYPDYSDII